MRGYHAITFLYNILNNYLFLDDVSFITEIPLSLPYKPSFSSINVILVENIAKKLDIKNLNFINFTISNSIFSIKIDNNKLKIIPFNFSENSQL